MTDWEQHYQQRETPWDKGAASPVLEAILAADDPLLWGSGPVVVPGCGTGHDVRALARETGLEIIGVDMAPTAVRLAAEVPRAGMERFLVGDFLAESWPPPDLEATAIWEHTCFCAIPRDRRDAYVRAAARTLDVGGRVIGVFFLTPWDPGEDPLQGPPFAATREEIISRFEPWFDLEHEWVPQVGFAGRVGREWGAIFARAGGCNPW
jgi:SAM-dependent methyltransferase